LLFLKEGCDVLMGVNGEKRMHFRRGGALFLGFARKERDRTEKKNNRKIKKALLEGEALPDVTEKWNLKWEAEPNREGNALCWTLAEGPTMPTREKCKGGSQRGPSEKRVR